MKVIKGGISDEREGTEPQYRSRTLAGRNLFLLAAAATAVVVAAAIAAMVGALVWLSLLRNPPASPQNGLTAEHYRAILGRSFSYVVLRDTFLFAVAAIVVALILGGWLAWFCERTTFRHRRLTYQLMTTGLLIPGFLFALGWQYLLGPHVGAISGLFQDQTGPINVGSPVGMGTLEGVLSAPAAFIMLAPALRNIDGAAEEAAELANISMVRRLARVTLPAVRGAAAGAIIYIFTIAVGAFDVPAILGLGVRQFTLSTYVYELAGPPQGQPDFGSGSVIAVVLLVIGVALSLAYMSVLRRSSADRGPLRAPGEGVRRLRRQGQRVGVVVLGGYALLGIVAPILALLWVALLPYPQQPSAAAIQSLSLQNFDTLPWETLADGAKNTAILVGVVPLVTVGLIGVLMSWTVVHSRSRYSRIVDVFAFAPHVIPPIVAGLAWLLVALYLISHVAPIYESIWVIAIAMCIAFLGFATRMTNGAFAQVSRELVEACEVADVSPFRTLLRVTLPLSKHSIFGAWIFVALLCYRNLALPAILSSPGSVTLATVVYSMYTSGSTGMSAATALITIAVAIPGLAIIWRYGPGMGSTRSLSVGSAM